MRGRKQNAKLNLGVPSENPSSHYITIFRCAAAFIRLLDNREMPLSDAIFHFVQLIEREREREKLLREKAERKTFFASYVYKLISCQENVLEVYCTILYVYVPFKKNLWALYKLHQM